MIIINVSESPHYKALKQGVIRYQKTKPNYPLWRFCVFEEDSQLLWGRFFENKPLDINVLDSVKDIFLDLNDKDKAMDLLISKKFANEYPATTQWLEDNQFKLYVPSKGSGPHSKVPAKWEDAVRSIKIELQDFFETNLTVSELMSVSKFNSGIIGPIQVNNLTGAHDFEFAKACAENICLQRGRDPVKGAELARQNPHNAPMNTAKKEVIPEDPIDKLSSALDSHFSNLTPLGHSMRGVISGLKLVVTNQPGTVEYLNGVNMIGSASIKYIMEDKNQDYFHYHRTAWDVLSLELRSELGFDSDNSHIFKQCLIEYLNNPITLPDSRVVQLLMHPVICKYTSNDGIYPLKRIPYHNTASDMVGKYLLHRPKTRWRLYYNLYNQKHHSAQEYYVDDSFRIIKQILYQNKYNSWNQPRWLDSAQMTESTPSASLYKGEKRGNGVQRHFAYACIIGESADEVFEYIEIVKSELRKVNEFVANKLQRYNDGLSLTVEEPLRFKEYLDKVYEISDEKLEI